MKKLILLVVIAALFFGCSDCPKYDVMADSKNVKNLLYRAYELGYEDGRKNVLAQADSLGMISTGDQVTWLYLRVRSQETKDLTKARDIFIGTD